MTTAERDGEVIRLGQTIDTLEAQRGVLGDVAVETAVGPLRARLAELASVPGAPAHDSEGEHKVVTVVFADVSGFTAMSERSTPEEVREVMNGLFDRLVPAIERFGGTIDKFIGDEIMAVFGAPSATEHHADHALRASLAMFEELAAFNLDRGTALGLHIGVNSGRVVAGALGSRTRREYSVIGDAVNVAARLEDASETGEILVGPATYRATSGAFDFESLAPIALKGKARPLPVYRLLAARSRVVRTTGLELRFTGRELDLDRVAEAVRTRVPAVAIVAPPGLGKSRLVAEVRARLDGRPWIDVAAMHHRAGESFAVAHELFDAVIGVPDGADDPKVDRALADHLASVGVEADGPIGALSRRLRGLPAWPTDGVLVDGLAPGALRTRLQEAFASLVESSGLAAPSVVCIEDVHWCDRSSLALLERLCTDLHPTDVTVLLTLRPDGDVAPTLLDHLRADASIVVVHLPPLGLDAVRAVLDRTLASPDDRARLGDEIIGRSDGNPFYLASYLGALLDDGLAELDDGRLRLVGEPGTLRPPDSLHAAVAERIDRLDPVVQEALRLAAVIGRRFDVGTLSALASRLDVPGCAAAVDGLVERQMLQRVDGGHLQFVHAVVQDVAYEGMLVRRRRHLHDTLATVLDGQPGASAAVVAWHLEQAGNDARAAVRYEEAAADAEALFAHDDALRHLERALALSDADAASRDRLVEHAGDLLRQLGRFTEACERLEPLVERSTGLDAARRSRKLGHVLIACQRLTDAEAAIGRAIEHTDGAAPAERTDEQWREHFAAHAELSWLLYLQSRGDEMRATAARLEPALLAHGTASELGIYHKNMALLALRSARFRADPAIVDLAELGARELAGGGHRFEACFAAFTHSFTLLWSFRLDEAERAMSAVLDESRRIGDGERHLLCLTYLAALARLRGDPSSCRAFASAGLSVARRAGSRLYEGACLANEAWADWRSGVIDRDELLDRAAAARERMAALPGYPFGWFIDALDLVAKAEREDWPGAGRVASDLLARPHGQRLRDRSDAALREASAHPDAERIGALVAAFRADGYL